MRKRLGEAADWTLETELAAAQLDALNGANWQRAQRRSSPKPKPTKRPSLGGGQRRSTLTGEQRTAKLLEFKSRRDRELAAMDGET